MAKQTTKPAAATTTTTAPANPMAALAATLVANPPAAPAAKVLATTLGTTTYRTANHVATLKGGSACPASFAAVTYKLGKVAYSPKPGTFTTMQWAAYQQAITANGGSATGTQIWAAGTALGMAGHQLASLPGFGPYRAKPGNLILA